MRLNLLAIGTRMPAWVEQGVAEYQKRLPREIQLNLRELPLAQRGQGSAQQAMDKEAQALRKAMGARDRIIALDVKGKPWSTEELAQQLQSWQMSGSDYSLIIGGPDGIAPDLLASAEQRWSLSALTLPHPMVRVLVVEQLYRAWSINAGHPYHRS